MIQYKGKNKNAIIVLHEIYGVNPFIIDICQQYHLEGYDVFCPNLLNKEGFFSYLDIEEAYHWYMDTVGFDIYYKINQLLKRLKSEYQKVMLTGFSVGATLAWRCSENTFCDGAICCYGSRIRDYLTVNPKCPTLLVFAKQDSFDVILASAKLQEKENVIIKIAEANHGFLDPYSENYNQIAAQSFHLQRKKFLFNYFK